MKSSLKDLPVTRETSAVVAQASDWGEMHASTAEFHETMDLAPLLRGLPDDLCQCPHWGFLLKGVMRAKFADH